VRTRANESEKGTAKMCVRDRHAERASKRARQKKRQRAIEPAKKIGVHSIFVCMYVCVCMRV